MNPEPRTSQVRQSQYAVASPRFGAQRTDSLADILERVLDRGVVIVGDIVVGVVNVELLTLKVRLLVASVDTAKEMGIDWWMNDPSLSSKAARERDALEAENRDLRGRLDALERRLGTGDTQERRLESGEAPEAGETSERNPEPGEAS
ncbi:gas vesicle protein GvpJ [Planosporangium sp. 12N6]|uniref:gas vesicle protein GvpJ n=1 Tax=Planosporangium spinosum TaxID=3402278 RepID=UPI003CEB4697